MTRLRELVMDEVDDVYEETDGDTPDHIIVSKENWERMVRDNKFETLRRNAAPNRRTTSTPGYYGMRVWRSGAVDANGKDALLLSEEAFRRIFPRAKDFYRRSP